MVKISTIEVRQAVIDDPFLANVSESKEPEPGEPTLNDVKRAISYIAGRCRLTNQGISGLGCWSGLTEKGEDLSRIVLVNGNEAAAWNASANAMERINQPRDHKRILNFCGSKPWYEFSQLSENVMRAAKSDQWTTDTIRESIDLFSKWRWKNSEAPEILTGLVLATFIQSLWPWRPQVAITGASKAGKTFLFNALEGIFGNLAEKSSHSSAAGIRQAIQTSSKVILCDEFEKSRHRSEILEMLRASSRGDKILRGTTNQRGQEFTLRHIVWVAAIEVGLKREPDKNRFVMLELLRPLEENRNKLVLPSPERLADLGQRMLAIAIRHAQPACELSKRLKQVRVPGVDERVIESFSVPASITAAACGFDGPKARQNLMDMLAGEKAEDSEPMGAILGVVNLVACDSWDCEFVDPFPDNPIGVSSPWWPDQGFAWRLAKPRRLAMPIKCSGKLSLWKPDAAALQEIAKIL